MYLQCGGLFWPSPAAAFLKVQILLMKETAHFNDRKLHNILLAQWRVLLSYYYLLACRPSAGNLGASGLFTEIIVRCTNIQVPTYEQNSCTYIKEEYSQLLRYCDWNIIDKVC